MANNAWSNDSITTLVIPTGATTGARIVLDGTTGTISVYNSAGTLVGTWGGAAGCLQSFAILGSGVAELCQGFAQFFSSVTPSTRNARIQGGDTGATNFLGLDSGLHGVGQSSAQMALISGAPGNEFISGAQRNVSGSMVMTDDGGNIPSNNLVHKDAYTLATNGLGQYNQAHNCTFIPKGAVITQQAAGAGSIPITFIVFNNAFTVTNFVGQAWNGGALFVNSSVAANIEFWG
jgi:hypothetical protein